MSLSASVASPSHLFLPEFTGFVVSFRGRKTAGGFGSGCARGCAGAIVPWVSYQTSEVQLEEVVLSREAKQQCLN
ncbi:hypothetical protein E2562_031044 [Oryza meyeriana var. granulata]|uniref:Uncharacterized protein n=1 Tax=Oryza meyeriana var. granulata TaxID=110450 RepID=A0A6G1FE89_9ORYZ|nr:hypothetical protein E2562_031044 [Oryza meyeriana var. granulata]